MHKSPTPLNDGLTPDASGRGVIGLCCCLLLTLLLAQAAIAGPVPTAPVQSLPAISADNAIISSPRTTLVSLVRLTDALHELVSEDGITRENERRLNNIYQQFEKLFDLRDVAPKYRRHVAVETAVYLRETLARFAVPPIEKVPDEDQMLAKTREGRAALYRLSGTPVVIRKTDAGVYEGRYQFTSATVAEAKSWFEAAKGNPACSKVEWLTGVEPVSRLRHCNSATRIHAGGGEISNAAGRFAETSCVRVIIRCEGNC